ncbi:hypothetical protein EZJ19_09970 [Parasulfuritortus cantonensis]|uniref:Uncharacterized protein n=1 Tax=Parasulfuritortus cantonensis TaxID=2528202 RepID=A0A4R1BA72_9PROT|nr:hypothetical protein [Parasulfuritortus cantonensis]TCJ13851.1 hypothetical protein EZJ19_09970 [Parasulfuritortus cantonensis]
MTMVELAFVVRQGQDALACEYRGINRADTRILIFDRLYSMANRELAAGWYYSALNAGRIELSQAVFPLPHGLHHENPEVPYGRELGAGEAFEGRFQVPLPVPDRTPYPTLLHRSGTAPGDFTELRFTLGWAPLPAALPSAIAAIERDGERLWLLPYRLALGLQQLVSVERHLAGCRFAPANAGQK